jgi:hypothetical protein
LESVLPRGHVVQQRERKDMRAVPVLQPGAGEGPLAIALRDGARLLQHGALKQHQ